MAFVNLPPNFQDMFYSITDRIAKLETGPNQAMYTAEAAQGSSAQALAEAETAQTTASNAQVQAVNAGVQANNAASQATIAQSQATIASSQATAAQVTANGKNKVYYSTSGPGATANTVGDIWYQYGTSGTYANKVIAQYSGAGGTSWTSVTVSGLIIANIDAGSITTGTLSAITITAGTGANSFNVSSSGVMSAQGVWVKGNITADTGTFNGSLYSKVGYFGESPNYWELGSSGLTGVGNATITAGFITGTTITGGLIQTSATTAVKLVGSTNSLSFMNAGTYVGHILNLSSSGILMHLGATANSTAGASFPYQYLGSNSIFLSSISGTSISLSTGSIGYTTTTHDFFGTIQANDNLNVSGSATFGTSNTFQYLSSSGTLRSVYTYGKAVTGRAMQINSAGDFGTTASTLRKKHDVQPYAIDTNKLLNLEVKTFKYLPEIDDKQEQQYGFIAEEAEALDLLPLILYNEQGQVDYFAYEKLPIFLLQLAQEQDARLKLLEGK